MRRLLVFVVLGLLLLTAEGAKPQADKGKKAKEAPKAPSPAAAPAAAIPKPPSTAASSGNLQHPTIVDPQIVTGEQGVAVHAVGEVLKREPKSAVGPHIDPDEELLMGTADLSKHKPVEGGKTGVKKEIAALQKAITDANEVVRQLPEKQRRLDQLKKSLQASEKTSLGQKLSKGKDSLQDLDAKITKLEAKLQQLRDARAKLQAKVTTFLAEAEADDVESPQAA